MGSEDPRAGSWRPHPGQKFGPSLEAGASWIAENVKGMEGVGPTLVSYLHGARATGAREAGTSAATTVVAAWPVAR